MSKNVMKRTRHFSRKIVRYIEAETYLLNNGLSVTKLNNMSDRQVIKSAKLSGWVDRFNSNIKG